MWTCAQTGDCCTVPLVMTPEEASLLARPGVQFVPWDGGKVALVTPDGSARCPFLGADQRCTVYAVRPYNCRRFACLRKPGEVLEPGGPLGCKNAERAVMTNREARRFMVVYQRKAQRWARTHGWTDDAE